MDPEPKKETAVSDSAPARGDADVSTPSTPAPAPAPAAGASEVAAPAPKRGARSRPKAGTQPNNVRKLRQRAMMSKAELARRAGVSPLTIDRVEAGCPCRMDTKRKILEALGLQPTSATEVFPEIDLD